MRTDGSRISSRSRGEFDANEWIREGDRMLASARSLRALWHVKRRQFNSALRNGQDVRHKRISEIEGLPRASMLLLGYAMEMFLKAGLCKAYRGCDKTMLTRDLKKKFGHDYKALSKEICFPGAENYSDEFNSLEKFVLSDARYPVSEVSHRSYFDLVNERVRRI